MKLRNLRSLKKKLNLNNFDIMDIMDIDTLQIKRVKGPNSYEHYVPLEGELVLVHYNDDNDYAMFGDDADECVKRYLVIGDGEHTVRELRWNVPSTGTIPLVANVRYYAEERINSRVGTDSPQDISTTSTVGTSQNFARSDHSHKLDYSIIARAIAAKENETSSTGSSFYNKFVRGRKIRIAQADPNKSTDPAVTGADDGSITIVVDSLPG